jgi:hypothetical protein
VRSALGQTKLWLFKMQHLTLVTGTAIWRATEPDFSILFILFTLATFWQYLQHKIADIIEFLVLTISVMQH